GTLIELAGKDCKQEPVMYGKGTCFKIKNIFYNVPARRKFLKSNQVELSNILREFERLALINESIDFTISNNDTLIHSLNAGSFKHRIVSLFGRTLDKQLVPVNVDTSIIKIEGFISMPEFSRKKNYLQYLFVNGRYMKHPYYHKAILTCFEQMIPHENQPSYFLKFTVDPQTIDVNIHPTKTEIKFENEQLIWPIITAAVKEAVGKYSTAPSIDFNTDDAIEIPVLTKGTQIVDPSAMMRSDYNPFEQQAIGSSGNSRKNKEVAADWDKLYNSFISDKYGSQTEPYDPEDNVLTDNKPDTSEDVLPDNIINVVENGVFDSIENTTNNYIQIHGRYIVTPVKSGLMVIDQHRAHLMILYHNLLHQQAMSGTVASQSVIFPELIEVSTAQNSTLHSIKNDLQCVGLKISEVENLTWKIESVPSGLNNLNSKEAIFEILDSVKNNIDKPEQNIKFDLIYELAKRSAIQYGTKLSQDEMDNIVGQLLAIPSPNYTPNV
ncbi:MAG: DNA mismatch repair endonuclease MutL, partial [Muribaculaceae bacterium]|nr:DNA mismatch repair endonuclease MutL [Muribaculaceae bacterium]